MTDEQRAPGTPDAGGAPERVVLGSPPTSHRRRGRHRRPPDRSARFATAAAVVIAALLVVDQARFVLDYMRQWVNEDHTILWYAARDLGAWQFPQPGYYGAAYFSVFEAWPAAVLRDLGVGLSTGVPLSTAALTIGGWVLLAVGAWKRHKVLSLLALAFPLVVSFEFLVSLESPGGRGAGVFLTMAGVALLVRNPDGRVGLIGFTLLGTLGAVLDFGSALLYLPALVYAVGRHARRWRDLALAAPALLPGAAYALYEHAFFARHPDYNLHRGEGFTPHLSILHQSVTNLSRYFSWEEPEIWRWLVIPVAVAVVVVVAGLSTRRLWAALSALAFVVPTLVALATPKALDGIPSVYVGWGRYFLAVPAALWFLLFVFSESRPVAWGRRTRVVMVGLVLAVAAGSFADRQVTFTPRLDGILAVARLPTQAARPVPRHSLLAKCAAIEQASKRYHVDIVVFRGDRIAAYACGALYYGQLETLYPAYDRRTWLMHREATIERTRFLVSDLDQSWCHNAAPYVVSCTYDPADPGVALVTTKPAPLLVTWRHLGEIIRPFTWPRPAGG